MFRYWFSRRSCCAGGLGSHRYGTFFELTTYRFRTVYLLLLFSCTQNVLRHLDIICQTFGKLNSSRDSGVSILYHYSVACCFLIHSENRLLTQFLKDTKYFVISKVGSKIKNVRILVLFPSFNAYETVNEFETFYEKPVPSQPSLHVRDETMKRCFITEYNIFQLDPLLPSLISYLHTSIIFYKYVEIL